MPIPIANDVRDIIVRSSFDALGLILPGPETGEPMLERDVYARVNKVLLNCGLKWDRRVKRHVGDGQDLVEQVLLTGQYTDTKKEFEAFYTPPALAARVATRLGLKKGWTGPRAPHVLEPSAGQGALVQAVLDDMPDAQITVVEKDPASVSFLNTRFVTGHGVPNVSVIMNDFTHCYPPQPGFDGVVMNPPFSKGQDCEHVLHALKFLAVGGRLVAIMSPGLMFRNTKPFTTLREMLRDRTAWDHEIQDLPDGSFVSSGTNVRTILLTVDRKA